MAWVAALISEREADFWLNLIAGVPLLFAEILLIALVLPIAIQFWEEKRWRGTRLKAMSHVLGEYQLVNYYIGQAKAKAYHAQTPPRLNSINEVLHEHMAHMDLELQTSLPVLGPDISRDLLELHYAWKGFVSNFPLFPVPNIKDEWHPNWMLNGFSENCDKAFAIGIMHRRLTLRYAYNQTHLSKQQARYFLALDTLPELYYASIKPMSVEKDWLPELDARYAPIKVAYSDRFRKTAKVPVLIHGGLIGRLRRRHMQPMYLDE